LVDLLSLTKKYCSYQITDYVQQIPVSFDIEKLRCEIFKFISDNKFGFSSVSLRLPKGSDDYITHDELLDYNGITAYNFLSPGEETNTRHNKEYTHWHPTLKDSYVSSLVPKLEEISGFNIGRIRLAWLAPKDGYNMHFDLEPIRFHIPLITNKSAYFIHHNTIDHMSYGNIYHLITTTTHTAFNFGPFPRLHLIFSTYADDKFDQELTSLAQGTARQQNLIALLKDSGIDEYSLLQLFNLENSTSNITGVEKKNKLIIIKKIVDLLSKN